jgi:hypothetical protein
VEQQTCNKCGKTKDLNLFVRQKLSKNGYRKTCKRCWSNGSPDTRGVETAPIEPAVTYSDDRPSHEEREKYTAAQNVFVHTILDAFTSAGKVDDNFTDHLSKVNALLKIDDLCERVLGDTFRRHADMKRATIIGAVWSLLQKL